MPTRFVRFVAAVAILVGVVGNPAFARAAPGVSAPNFQAVGAPPLLPVTLPGFTLPPVSSLGVQFIQVASAANVLLNTTIIDNPLTDNHPNAIILVTPNYNPGGIGAIYDNHPIGVFYTAGYWVIFNEDSAAMPIGAAFNVIIPTTGANVFVNTYPGGGGDSSSINNPLTNGQPTALVLVTQNADPGGSGLTDDGHPIGVYYNGVTWTILNEDAAAIPANAAFNVFVLPASAGAFVHTAVAGNHVGDHTTINHALTDGNPNALIFVTPNFNPGGVGGVSDAHPIGVFYTGSQWAIFNQNLGVMPANAAFNVLVLVANFDVFAHTTTSGNHAGDHTSLDNALTNGNPNALAFITPNYNPGGVGGAYNNHPTGVYYTGVQWAVFNEDLAAMPVNAAFNVALPAGGANVFLFKAQKVTGDHTTIDNPLTNNHPNAMLLVTPNYNPGDGGGVYDKHPIGVAYIAGQWEIFNEDGVTMPDSAQFNVLVAPAGPNVFVHTSGASLGDFTAINNPLTNNNRGAIVLVTQNYDPGGTGGVTNPHPVGVYFTGNKWAIFNEDTAAMGFNVAFNVFVFNPLALPVVLR